MYSAVAEKDLTPETQLEHREAETAAYSDIVGNACGFILGTVWAQVASVGTDALATGVSAGSHGWEQLGILTGVALVFLLASAVLFHNYMYYNRILQHGYKLQMECTESLL